jgi:YHS domain-containing protein
MLKKPLIALISTALLLLSITFVSTVHAAKPVYSGGRDRAAIRGYDPVSYFTQGKPVKGLKEFAFKYNGAKWLFSSQDNLALFKSNPEKYSPQFGGYCAYAVSKGSTASIKPEYFTIHKNKLYLNYSKSVHKKWNKDKDDYIEDANQEWPDLVDE